MHRLVLASQSPRRLQLLEDAGFAVAVNSVNLSELIDKNLTLEAAIQALARAKVEACRHLYKHPKSQGILILGADTLVVLQGQVLGKPENLDQAREFLERLSQQTHSVMTGICVYDLDKDHWVQALDKTEVQFRKLDRKEIEAYVLSGEPMDKAGAYAIQGGAGKFVTRISGSRSNVIGLPMELLTRIFNEQAWRPLRKSSS